MRIHIANGIWFVLLTACGAGAFPEDEVNLTSFYITSNGTPAPVGLSDQPEAGSGSHPNPAVSDSPKAPLISSEEEKEWNDMLMATADHMGKWQKELDAISSAMAYDISIFAGMHGPNGKETIQLLRNEIASIATQRPACGGSDARHYMDAYAQTLSRMINITRKFNNVSNDVQIAHECALMQLAYCVIL